MSYLDEWAQLIARQLKSEADLVSTQAKSELYEDAARDTFIRVVLEPFLPGSYAVGSGRVIDSSGNISSPQDIVIYRRDYPQFNMPGSHNVFIYESVLATIQVCSKLVRKSFFNAMDQCVSMGTLNPAIEPATLKAMALKMNMVTNTRQQYIHPDPLNTGRFNLIGRPQCFVYAFTGYQTSDKQLTENLVKWIDHYHENNDLLEMKCLPSVIATQGCFAWRNTAPFAIKSQFLMGVGIDHAPLRLIFLQLMHSLNRRLQNTSEGYGIKATIAPYLAGFEPPAISEMVGTALNPGDKKPMPVPASESAQTALIGQTPGVSAAKSTVENRAEMKSERIAKLVVSAKKAVAAKKARSAALETSDNHGTDQTPEIQNAAAQEMPASSVPAGGKKEQPVIESLSMLKPDQTESLTEEPAHNGNHPGPASALSMFNDGPDGEAEDYQFNPVDMPASRADENSSDEALEVHNDGVLSAPETGTHDAEKAGGDEGKFAGTRQFSTQQAEDEEDDGFIDTLVETAESLAQDTSEPSSRKTEYITESLI